MVSDCVRESFLLLELIAHTKKPAVVVQVLQKGGDILTNAITEIVHNILFGRIGLTDKHKGRLAQVKPILRKLANKDISVRTRTAISKRTPGIIQSVIRIALPTVKILHQ